MKNIKLEIGDVIEWTYKKGKIKKIKITKKLGKSKNEV